MSEHGSRPAESVKVGGVSAYRVRAPSFKEKCEKRIVEEFSLCHEQCTTREYGSDDGRVQVGKVVTDIDDRAIDLQTFSVLHLDVGEHGQSAAESGVAEGKEPLSVRFQVMRPQSPVEQRLGSHQRGVG